MIENAAYPVHIVFICDDNYIIPTCTAIQSLVESKRADSRYVLHIVCASLSAESEHIFEVFKSDTVDMSIVRADANRFSDFHVYKENTMVVATVSALLKFALPELLPALDKVLYLDGDLVVREDLTSLYQIELSTNMVAAAPDCGGFFTKLPIADSVQKYFNSGVMLLNLKQMRLENATEQLLQAKREKTDSNLMDQDAFNLVFDGRVIEIPIWYNFMALNLYNARGRWSINSINERFGLNCNNVVELFESWKILHFASKKKPWKNPNMVFAWEWYNVYKRSPVFDAGAIPASTYQQSNFFSNPEDSKVLSGFECVVPVVFACNEKYAPYAGVAIQSIIENAKPGRFYRVYVLHSRLSDNMVRLLEAHSTFQLSVNCINVDLLIQSKCTQLNESARFSKEMYYRFIIPEVFYFYSQVIYLDCDLIVNRDIADILQMEIGDNLLAVVRNTCSPKRREQVTEFFHLNADNYFNSGVLVINIRQWIAEKTAEKCFAVLNTVPRQQLVCPDQDILNIVCQDRVLYMDAAWNFYWHMVYGDPVFAELNRSITNSIGENFYILHFASALKPWSHPEYALSRYFWQYARHSIFYEIILKNFFSGSKSEHDTSEADAIRASWSYRIGRSITFMPRKVRGGIKCYRDHGFAQTFRRTLYHLGLWEDEGTPRGLENRPRLLLYGKRILHTAQGRLKDK